MESVTKSVRVKKDLENKVNEFLEKNPTLSFSQLIALAVEKYISEPNSIELVPIKPEELERSVNKILKDYKPTLDKLK
jgi:hypothetical protein